MPDQFGRFAAAMQRGCRLSFRHRDDSGFRTAALGADL